MKDAEKQKITVSAAESFEISVNLKVNAEAAERAHRRCKRRIVLSRAYKTAGGDFRYTGQQGILRMHQSGQNASHRSEKHRPQTDAEYSRGGVVHRAGKIFLLFQ